MAAGERILEVRELSVGLDGPSGSPRFLDDVSFELDAGEILGIIGEAGAGKTVLARTLVNGLTEPLRVSGGQVLYRSRDLLRLSRSELARIRGNEIGNIGANPAGSLDPTVSVGQQILEKLRAVQPKLSKAEARDRVLEVLAAVRIPSPATRFHEYPFQFSGGMMQRVMIVDALVTNPTFLVADNITQSLDVTVAAQILRLIRELRERMATAIVFISSSLPMVSEIADEILVMQGGRIVEKGSASALINQPRHRYTRSLLEKLPRIWGSDISAPQATPSTDLLRVVDVAKTYRVRRKGSFAAYNEVQAVRGVSLAVREGENFGIVGESGCGKSTLTRLLAGLEAPDRGRIEFEGRDLGSMKGTALVDMRRSFQLLLQDPYGSLPARMPVGRIIAEPLLIHRICPRKEVRDRVLAAMAEVALDSALENRLTVGLSAGQRQRISIARALVLEPKLLILDETLSALDPVEQSRLLELFARLQRDHGFTYIFISHDMALVRKVCNRIAVMYLGRVVELAANESLFENPGHPYSRALLSAVPTLDDHPFKTQDHLLEGEPPSPVDIPRGCTFRSRCPVAMASCDEVDPMPAPWMSDSTVACHLADQAGHAGGDTRGRPSQGRRHAQSA